MNATIGTLLILVNLFLPGLLFLRLYYSGEFSKQFSTRIPLLQLGFRAFIPGLLILTFGLWFVSMIYTDFTILKVNTVYSELLNSPNKYSEITINFLNYQIKYLVSYTISVCIIGAVFGYISQLVVRYFSWDISFKILRFKNNWAYIFSGQYLKFDRFQKTHTEITFGEHHPQTNEKIMMTIVDALVDDGQQSKMYSGTFVDYDLDASDSNSLERIYLTNAYRYKFLTEDELKKNPESKRFEKKEIPGDLFLLETKNLINLNITYVPSVYHRGKKEVDQDTNKIRRNQIWTKFKGFINLIVLLFFIFFAIILFTGYRNNQYINFLSIEFNFLQKIWLILTLLVIWSIVFYDKKRKQNDIQSYKSSVKGMFIFIAISLGFIFWEAWAYKFFY